MPSGVARSAGQHREGGWYGLLYLSGFAVAGATGEAVEGRSGMVVPEKHYEASRGERRPEAKP